MDHHPPTNVQLAVYISCLHSLPSQPLAESFAENGLGSVQLCLSESVNIRVLSV